MVNNQSLLNTVTSNLLIGAARILDVGGHISQILATSTPKLTAAQSAAADWRALDEDLRESLESFSQATQRR